MPSVAGEKDLFARARQWLRSPAVSLAALIAAGLSALFGSPELTRTILYSGLIVAGLPLVLRTARDVLRGHFATDIVASLAVASAVPLHEPLAGLVVTLMQTGGEALEQYAQGRASAAVHALEQQAPRTAHRVAGDSSTTDIPVEEIQLDDLLLIRPGEMVPADGVVVSGTAHVDTSRITGEPIPVSAVAGIRLSSGCINLDGALTLRAEALARESQYERIVELVRSAQASKAPMQRMADRYAGWFTPLTLLMCAVAYLVSGDADRVLAVLVVATPCPLLLAVPVAIIGGINRAARGLIVIRTGGALEQLGNIDTVVFDKTGTLTIGRPAVSVVTALPPFTRDEVIRLAASAEHASGHLLARSVTEYAAQQRIAVVEPQEVVEAPGHGVSACIGGKTVKVGARSFAAPEESDSKAGLRAYVSVDGRVAGHIEFDDKLRPGARDVLAGLTSLGVRRHVILSGDSVAHTAAIGAEVGIADVRAELRPGDKVSAIEGLMRDGARVLMVGDGTNDAPALSAATVGVALASHGGGISAEAADVVVLADNLDRVRDAVMIGQRTMRIARQSVRIGIAVSGLAMCVAAAGYIRPVTGALLQELLDVAVILNALRSSRAGRTPKS